MKDKANFVIIELVLPIRYIYHNLVGKVVIKQNTNMQQNPYEDQKRNLQLQLAQIEQREAQIAAAKASYPPGDPQLISLEQQEASLMQQKSQLEMRKATIEQQEINWLRNQQQ